MPMNLRFSYCSYNIQYDGQMILWQRFFFQKSYLFNQTSGICVANCYNTIPVFHVSLHMDSSHIGTRNSTNNSSVCRCLEKSPWKPFHLRNYVTLTSLYLPNIFWFRRMSSNLLEVLHSTPSNNIIASVPALLVLSIHDMFPWSLSLRPMKLQHLYILSPTYH